MKHFFAPVLSLALLGGLCACSSDGTPPAGAPANIQVTAKDGYNIVSWDPVPGATFYNVYWSTTAGVDPETAEVFPKSPVPFYHGHLVNGVAIFYAVKAANGAGESAELSDETSGTPTETPAGDDPLFIDQWHLKNTGQNDGTAGEDLKVLATWDSGNNTSRGEGIRIAVVDDGLDIDHEDLAANVLMRAHYDYTTPGCDVPVNVCDPSPKSSGDTHGTSVSGVAAARDLNAAGGRGVAPRADLVGFNALQDLTTANEADAMERGSPDVAVSNNSWGPPDGTGHLDASTSLWQAAVDEELESGRGGLGTVFAWAAGNGADCRIGTAEVCVDNSNYDGYANYRGVAAVCAVNDDGQRSVYSERGANLWVCAPSSDSGHQGITTTRPNDSYTSGFGGTSSATPAVVGVVALILQANPGLTWRDVREILAETARQNDSGDGEWTTNGDGYNINHNYGFGVADAGAAVTAAASWTPVAVPQTIEDSGLKAVNLPIPDDNSTGASDTIAVSTSGITFIEWVEVYFTAADHTYSGDLEITLTAPSSTESVLAETHPCAGSCTPYSNWRFGSARHLGESADGDWTLKVADGAELDTGTFQSWRLVIYGR